MDGLPFAVCAGGVTGRDHVRSHRNGQDACGVDVSAEGIVLAVNGDETALDAGPENAPDYLAYALIDAGATARSAVRLHRACATRDLTSILLATDGALDLIRTAAEPIDGAAQGGLDQFTRDLRYARNPSLVKKRLTVIGTLHGRLHDDTAIALLTRRAA